MNKPHLFLVISVRGHIYLVTWDVGIAIGQKKVQSEIHFKRWFSSLRWIVFFGFL